MEFTENKLKEILTDQREEFQHFMGIMQENTNAQFQLMGEQFQGIKNTLDAHTEAISSHTHMLGALMEDISIIKVDVQFLKTELRKKVDYDDFDNLTKRVALLEAKSRS
jgi:hypothetical protein